MKEFPIIICVAIICITIIIVFAISHGVNGVLLSGGIGAICTLIGITLDHYFKKYKLKLRYEN